MDHQEKIDRAVDLASVAISIELDRMIEALPAGANVSEVASDLVARLLDISDNREFAEILQEALIARKALTELGVKL